MQRHGSSMKPDCPGAQAMGCDSLARLEAQCHCLQVLIGELLQKNQELRFEIARLNQQIPSAAGLHITAGAGPSRTGCFVG
jgi:hypothetical protein